MQHVIARTCKDATHHCFAEANAGARLQDNVAQARLQSTCRAALLSQHSANKLGDCPQVASGPGIQTEDRKLGHALKSEPRSGSQSPQISAVPGRAGASEPLPAQSPLAFVPIPQAAAAGTAVPSHAGGSTGLLPASDSRRAPAARTGTAATLGAPLTTSQQHQLLMGFLARQEAQPQDPLALLRQQQAEFIQNNAVNQVRAREPVRRRPQTVESPFKRQKTSESAYAVVEEDQLQQRERRQVWSVSQMLSQSPQAPHVEPRNANLHPPPSAIAGASVSSCCATLMLMLCVT